MTKGGADLIIIYNSGRFRMMGHGSTAGLMAYGDANVIAMEIGEYEVLPIVEEIPVICGVHATDPRRRMWHWLGQVKDMGFSGVNNFPTHTIVDGHFRSVLEETGMSVKKEFEMIGLARRMDLFSIVYVGTPEEAVEMAKSGADAIIAHVGTTVGGSIGVTNAVVSWEETIKRTQDIIDAAKTVRDDIFYLCHGGPINTPEDADRVIQATDCVGFVGASSLERMSVEESLTNMTRQFKSISVKRKKANIMTTIAVLGTLDSKGEEYAFVAGLIRARGHQVLLIDVGTGGPPTVVPNFSREQVAAFAGIDLAEILTRKDRGECVVAMSQAAPVREGAGWLDLRGAGAFQ